MPLCLLVGNVPLFFFLKRIVIPSQHNVAPLYWPLPLGVPCQRLRKIMVLSDHSLIFFFFLSLMKKYLSWMNLEILIFHFENKNCFNVSLKQYVFEILQLLGFFLGKEIICSCLAILSLVRVCHEVTFYFL
jgi:hypothetical protein